MRNKRNEQPTEIKPISSLMRIIKVNEIPTTGRHGKASMIVSLPFWIELLGQLERGLTRMEAIDLNLADTVAQLARNGVKTDEKKLYTGIRYQLDKQGHTKRYSILARDHKRRLIIVDNESGGIATL